MAKKVKKTPKTPVETLPDNMLPQNILPVGERVEENKNIYISQSVYKTIHKFTQNKTTNESGGMLIGTVIEEFGKTNIVISGFVEAKYCDATPTTLKFTHETWDYVHKEIDKKYKDKKIVGWIHTHPDFGIFLSEYDKFIHQNFFSEAYQIAYVVDPIQDIEGFYFWINGNIEKCKGFYIYDKTGTQITVDVAKDESTPKKEPASFGFSKLLTAAMAVAMVFLAFGNASLNRKVEQLETACTVLEEQVAYQKVISDGAMSSLYEKIVAQSTEIQKLTQILKDAGLIQQPEQETENNTEGNTENE